MRQREPTQSSQIRTETERMHLFTADHLNGVSDIEEGYVTETDITTKTVTYTKGDYWGSSCRRI